MKYIGIINGKPHYENEPMPNPTMSIDDELAKLQAQVKELRGALQSLKAACCDVMIPSMNEAIHQGFKMETWTPEQMQWAKAIELTDKALTQ